MNGMLSGFPRVPGGGSDSPGAGVRGPGGPAAGRQARRRMATDMGLGMGKFLRPGHLDRSPIARGYQGGSPAVERIPAPTPPASLAPPPIDRAPDVSPDAPGTTHPPG